MIPKLESVNNHTFFANGDVGIVTSKQSSPVLRNTSRDLKDGSPQTKDGILGQDLAKRFFGASILPSRVLIER